jgi:hypothetical protein
MRKRITNPTEADAPTISEEWLDLEKIARVEVTSEDPLHPIEWAFRHGKSLGWRASRPDEQTMRLLFDEPKDLRRIWLRFSEPKVLALELTIDPDLGKNQALATLAEWRMA